MAESVTNLPNDKVVEPELRREERVPAGVVPKNLKPALYLGAALLVIVAAVFSGTAKKPPAQQNGSGHDAPQPVLQDNTANNVADLKSQVAAAEAQTAQDAAQRQATSPVAGMTAAQQAVAAAYGPTGQSSTCAPGQPCAPSQQQLSPAEQTEQQLAAKDRELAYASRFASNLVYSQAQQSAHPEQHTPASANIDPPAPVAGANAYPYVAPLGSANTSLIAPQAPSAGQSQSQPQHRPEVNIDSATGQPYVVYEGTVLDTVLINRLDGDAAGPVKVLVSNPVYSHDRQHVLIPEGTIVLGEARKIGASGFGQQRRMAVVFHRMIMPDGYSVDLDQFQGLNQSGAEGLKDKVNNHYLEIFGMSIALGVIAGAGEIEQGGGTISTSGSQAFATGASASVSQSATSVLDQFLEIPPTITIREGHRVKVYFTQDMLLPAYENHTIPQSF
ncbi:TrbI/VirB10 family protein [Acidipila rosea]|uniref:Type IV secretion system protein VirB10 n=1 Tax=Acidipila rosea TaxID=768535 RepID=A0A4R1LC14_9BACT|nr:TrbI/VirB10 family protein [Acidipila rosea]TCK75922.1 type IV secretion system protein VirB10 [Acidipila rosea]